MIALLSLVHVGFGVATAVHAPRHPNRTATLETAAGIALIVGLAMMGFGLRALH